LRDIVSWMPLDRMLIETDSPYLAPAPHRGKTNDPSLVPWVARQIASLRQLEDHQVGELTSANFDHLFKRVLN